MSRFITTQTQVFLTPFLFVLIAIAGCSGGSGDPSSATAQAGGRGKHSFDPPEVTNGERLFLETRFAQFFKTYLDAGGEVNVPLPAGDLVMDLTTLSEPGQGLPGPFAGLSMNCRACHLVDEHVGTPGGGMRTYGDFARRSPVPAREDRLIVAPRNSPPLVNASLPRPGGVLFHFDGEFSTLPDLTGATLTGRNFGWLAGERAQAIAHIAKVVREDNGTGSLAQDFGGLPLAVMLTGSGQAIPKEFRIPPAFRVHVAKATDEEIFDGVVRLVSAYVEQLMFSQDEGGNFNLSPFDVFLARNGFPQNPENNESDLDYSRRLRSLIANREQAGTLQFVSGNPNSADGRFQFHEQEFRFGPEELTGLKIFLAEPAATPPTPQDISRGGIGNCLACHAAPAFTDFKLHNTGTAQTEYDDIHGAGKFQSLVIPNLTARNANYDAYLPATENHPSASERFRSVPVLANPELTDLGVWNVFANPDIPGPQTTIQALLCDGQAPCLLSESTLLDRAIARFKTPGLRDLGHSAPYMHNGRFDTLDSLVQFYRGASAQARAGTLRNGAPQLQGIALTPGDVPALVSFLKSLNEDYE